ncbi:MAG TPA: YidC/Oxa1 family membrane protein insertase [Candidatus Limnocylindria bacterium]
MPLPFADGFLGIQHFTPPWDVFFLPLFNLLVLLYRVLFTDLAVAIIVFTIIVRFALWPLFVRQIRSQKEMQRMQPLVREIQRKHKGNRQKVAEETMALYRKHGVSQFGGCLPLVLQMPILIALYSVLNRISSVVTYTAPDDLKQKFADFLASNPAITLDPITPNHYHIAVAGSCTVPPEFTAFLPLNCQLIEPLKFAANQSVDTTVSWLFNLNLGLVDHVFSVPVFGITISALAILTGIFQFVQAKMTSPRPNPDDPTASTATTMIYIFPVMMVLWGSFLPSGLILYYGVLTLILIVQQFILMGWGNLFPLFGWQPRWAPPPADAPPPKRLKADDERGTRDKTTGRDDRPQATNGPGSAPGSSRQQPRSGSRRRRGRRR